MNKKTLIQIIQEELSYILAEQSGKITNEAILDDSTSALRIVTPKDRDTYVANIEALLKKQTAPGAKFNGVTYKLIPSKKNTTDIILKLAGPMAFTMGKAIKMYPEFKGTKVSKFKQSLIPA